MTIPLRKISYVSLGMHRMSAVSTQKIVKLAVVGDGGVGKSTLISRLATGEFIDKNMTVGFDVESWTISTNDDSEAIKVACFDFGGQKQFRFFQGSLILGSKIALIVFDCNSYRSLTKIGEWMDLLNGVPNDKKLLVGTKLDVGTCITDKDIQKIADEFGIDYILVSSKTGENFQQLISQLTVMVDEL
ncbi:MAG: GTP-binding protein [Candidatus Thorarchaeota archaeon]|nr:MAG: GTP-binding protein [Candidatus Thorarchaeota archaeon]